MLNIRKTASYSKYHKSGFLLSLSSSQTSFCVAATSVSNSDLKTMSHINVKLVWWGQIRWHKQSKQHWTWQCLDLWLWFVITNRQFNLPVNQSTNQCKSNKVLGQNETDKHIRKKKNCSIWHLKTLAVTSNCQMLYLSIYLFLPQRWDLLTSLFVIGSSHRLEEKLHFTSASTFLKWIRSETWLFTHNRRRFTLKIESRQNQHKVQHETRASTVSSCFLIKTNTEHGESWGFSANLFISSIACIPFPATLPFWEAANR